MHSRAAPQRSEIPFMNLSKIMTSQEIWTVLLALGLAGAVLAGIAAVSLTCSPLSMDWQPVDPAEHSQVEALEAELLELGFPEEVLRDLTLEDILACQGAVRVVSKAVQKEADDYYNTNTPKVTSVAVELAGERERWRTFHHFALQELPRRGTYSIQLWPAWHIYEGWSPSGTPVTGRVLWDSGGVTRASPYFFLDSETYTSDTIFWGPQTSTDVFASFSLPGGGEHHRGYVCYEAAQQRDGYIIDSWFNFVQPTGFFQYPVRSAQEWQMAGYFNWSTQPFLQIQYALQFFPESLDTEGVW